MKYKSPLEIWDGIYFLPCAGQKNSHLHSFWIEKISEGRSWNDIRILPTSQNDDWRRKTHILLFSVCSMSEAYLKKIKRYAAYMISGQYSLAARFFKNISRVKSLIKYNMNKNCVYSILCNCSRVYKGERCNPLKVRLDEHRKAVCRREIDMSGRN